MVIGAGNSTINYQWYFHKFRRTAPSTPDWMIGPIFLAGALDALGAIGRLFWKRWGFISILTSCLAMFLICLYSRTGSDQAEMSVLSLVVVYVLLFFGRNGNGWSQLD